MKDPIKELYQTVYNERPGTRCSCTHSRIRIFDEPLLEALRKKGVEMAFVTLHVGSGTFQPVRVDNIEEHTMHSKYAEVPLRGGRCRARFQGTEVIG